ncbi:hypothetical protein GCM10007390_10160 [Persicitalea jodogahamensis]|uniref:DUF11 domain-containing protein n=2 Tax=Persicitalea jodogahamensis TaxID=402147 RepID=A0A8J3D6A3_9BACT|nr:hypothetical protein GCM10007390_10160 [Persicitalea jodogahamensis]
MSASPGYAQIMGKVFRDFNSNGIIDGTAANPVDAGDVGVPMVKVTAYAANGSVADSTRTDASGSYTLATSPGKYRIEFSDFLTGDFASGHGSDNNTSVQFVSDGATGVNFGIQYPNQYCQADPLVTTSCFVSGDPQPGTTTGGREVLVSLAFNATGEAPHNNVSKAEELGAVMGLAYQRAGNKMYSAAFTKRHVGYGPGGPGAVHVSEFSANRTSSISNGVFFDFGATAGADPHDADLPTQTPLASRDNGAYDAVGKIGLGDIDISDDEKTLFVVNLANRSLYSIDISTKDTIGYAIPNPAIGGGSYRPFAVKYYRGKVYVGVVATREDAISKTDTTGLGATVYQFDPDAGTFTPVLSFPLTFKKQPTNADKTGIARAEYWRPWSDTYDPDRNEAVVSYPQPWLTDIEFDVDGDMILGIRDRFGDQIGYQNYIPFETNTSLISAISPGAIMRAGKCGPADVWTLESNGAVCDEPSSADQQAQVGPGGGKYYFGDQVQSGANHGTSSMGGLALYAGSGRVIMTAVDPIDKFNQGGIKRLVNSDGSKDGGGEDNGGAVLYTGGAFTYGKANGLGDIELLCDLAPIEIGNRVWKDVNKDGVQDAGEPPLVGVTLVLYDENDIPVDTTTTDAMGHYYFSSANDTDVLPNQTYKIRVTDLGTNTSVDSLTLASLTVGGSLELNDGNSLANNDAALDGGLPTINVATGDYGQNNHTYDIGFLTILPLGSIGDYVFKDANRNGKQDTSEIGVAGVKVILYASDSLGVPGTKLDSMLTNSVGRYLFDSLTKGDYVVEFVKSTLPADCNAFTAQDTTGIDGIDDTIDSDADTNSGFTGVVSLDPVVLGPTSTALDSIKTNNLAIDAGLLAPLGSLGDFVWKDLNDNGRQDAGEPGVNNVKVVLWSAVGGSSSAKLDSTLTSGNGAYSFTGLLKGDYVVQLDLTTLPDSCTISSKPNAAGVPDSLDSDFGADGLSGVVSLDPTLGGINKDNPTIDAALVTPCYPPTIGNIAVSTATCNGKDANSDASFTLTNIGGGDRYNISTVLGNDSIGSYALATILANGTITMASLPNPVDPGGQTYYVRVFNGDSTCYRDTTVVIPYRDCSSVCVTPDAGEDLFICKPSTTADLPDALSYQKWVAGPQGPVAGTIDPSTGVVSGLTASGVYSFILLDTALASTCADTVFIYRGVLDLPDQTTCFDTLTLPSVSGALYQAAAGNSASITPEGYITGMNAKDTSYNFIISNGECSDTITVTRQNCDPDYDLALDKSIDKKLVMLGETVNYTIRVWNEGQGNATGVEVTDSLNAGVQYISHATAAGDYDPVTKIWTIDILNVGDTVTLTVAVKVVAQGVWFNTAEITKMNEEDVDSTPGDGENGEDDIDRECFTVPVQVCRGQGTAVELAVPDEYTGVVWFRKTQNGQPVQVAQGNTFIATETELGSYEYTFTSSSGSCPAEGCCPTIIVVEDCCPVDVCVPFVITKRKK